MKKVILLLTTLGLTTISFANENVKQIDFDKITSQQLSDITNKCLNNDYQGETCQQLKKWQDERKKRMEREAKQLLKHM